jgi:methylmalonyl-CoA mutase cobalamin-binding domain/chain
MSKEELLSALSAAIADGEIEKAAEVAKEIVEAGVPVEEAIRVGASEGMKECGRRFEAKDYYVADLIVSGEAMKAALAVLGPQIQHGQAKAAGRVVLGTVQGDVHDIGKNLVATMLQVNGFEVFDLGINVTAATFADKAREVDADIVGASAYTSTSIAYQRDVLTALRKAGIKSHVMYLVGGAPTTLEWAQTIGADGWAEDAWQAVEVAADLIERKKSVTPA